MSQKLTQPEEIDRILMLIAGREIAADASIPDAVPPTENIRGAGCGAAVMGMDFSNGATPAKTSDCRSGFKPVCGK